jgi:hypothetical protein
MLVNNLFSAPPDPPGRPLVNAFTSRSVNLSWTPPLHTHHSPVTRYVVLVREGEGGKWATAKEQVAGGVVDTGDNETSFQVEDLRPFATYSFKVAAVNAAGRSVPSEESYYTMTLRAGEKEE